MPELSNRLSIDAFGALVRTLPNGYPCGVSGVWRHASHLMFSLLPF